jgi:hypothetical protein
MGIEARIPALANCKRTFDPRREPLANGSGIDQEKRLRQKRERNDESP